MRARCRPHVGAKHVANWASVPASYALSPAVKIVPPSASSSRAVAAAPGPQSAMSPAPTKTAGGAALGDGAAGLPQPHWTAVHTSGATRASAVRRDRA